MKKLVYPLLTVLFVALLAPTAFAVEIKAIEGASADSNYRFVFDVHQGETQKGVMQLKSFDDSENLKLYAADEGTTSEPGGWIVKEMHENSLFFGSWIDIELDEIEMAPNSSKLIDFSITIPEDAPVGTYKGGIAAESLAVGSVGGVMNVKQRTLARATIHVLEREPVIDQISKEFEQGSPIAIVIAVISVLLVLVLIWAIVNHKRLKKLL
jgi:hypothetical protein